VLRRCHDGDGIGVLIVWYRAAAKCEVLSGVRRGGVDTLQATIGARIDRLVPKAKRALSAAAVIGSRFSLGLLTTLGVEPVVDDLVVAQLIDQVSFTRQPEYAFHHPLIRTVAYESQLKPGRAEMHGRVAAAIEARDVASADDDAALIAEHLEAAGDLHAA
jgi:predicted ATPase